MSEERRPSARVRSLAATALCAALVAASVQAQKWPWANQWYRDNYRSSLTQPPQPYQKIDPDSISPLGADPLLLLGPQVPPSFAGVNRNLPIFQGFPTFPPSVLGYGGKPGARLPMPFSDGASVPGLPALAMPDTNAWPSWFGGDTGGDPAGYNDEVGLLLASSEVVYFRPSDERAFVPLAYYDKFRVLRDGDEAHIRQDGEFRMIFKGGSKVRAYGPVETRVDTLTEDVVALRVGSLSHVWLTAHTRPMRVTFGSGTVLELQNGMLELQNADGFVKISNAGTGTAALRNELGTFEIPPSHRVTILLAVQGHEAIPAALQLEGDLGAKRAGRILEVDGGALGGAVVWNGARIRVPKGATLKLDALAGDTFPDNRPKPK